ncbi:phospho-N-acetylmuramoyl-pentapeptide-transferase [candidate division FCPU426 bacterium]|nr:phospho-N-acetylmuramoyl-pentapeptide-transferase [candidate division FCPU426 bacterium]
MLYYWLYPLAEVWTAFNVFRYITFRSVYAALTAFLICLFLGPVIIRTLKAKGIGQKIRLDGPDRHQQKAGTPTMGGLILLPAILASIILWARWEFSGVWIVAISLVWFGGVGFLDDYLKTVQKKPKGLIAKKKLVLQLIGSVLIMGLILYWNREWAQRTCINLPFFKQGVCLPLWFYLAFGVLVITYASNAVNLTDGLDGLAIGSLALVAATFTVMSYVVANVKFASYLKVIFIPGGGELTVVCSALVGAALGFLWFNTHPAEVFMGDTGSLSLGGVLGTMAVLIKQEVLLVVVGGIFVAEVLSVILQVGSFKLTGKRIFLMAPLHHHFEMKGWSEPKIIIRFWIVGIMLAVITLSTLKLR